MAYYPVFFLMNGSQDLLGSIGSVFKHNETNNERIQNKDFEHVLFYATGKFHFLNIMFAGISTCI